MEVFLLFLSIFSPLVSFCCLMAFGTMPFANLLGVGGILLSNLGILGLLCASPFTLSKTWFSLGATPVFLGFRLDGFSVWIAFLVCFIALWIVIFSVIFMRKDEDKIRYFAFFNLFVFMMLILVMADSLPTAFLGWEGMGVCSYVLIGFWYRDEKASQSALKAFLMTHLADLFFVVGMILCAAWLGTTQINQIGPKALIMLGENSPFVFCLGGCFLLAALGKSAQFPFFPWLIGAMSGPTPVSALIHAATMVIAGVYLMARLHILWEISSALLFVTFMIGLVSALIGALCALFQDDMKKILAYSTMSQIGYMWMGIGSKVYLGAVYHLMTHAFFKSLLFLCAGVFGYMYHIYDIKRLSGVAHKHTSLKYLMMIGCACLFGFPFITSGFYSKEYILEGVYNTYGIGFWFLGVLGVFLTSLYVFRLWFILYPKNPDEALPVYGDFEKPMQGALIILGLFSLGFFFFQPILWRSFELSLPSLGDQWHFGPLSLGVCLGILVAFLWAYGFYKAGKSLWWNWASKGFGLDDLYTKIAYFYAIKVQKIRRDYVVLIEDIGVDALFLLHQNLSFLQNGKAHQYVLWMLFSVLCLTGMMVFR